MATCSEYEQGYDDNRFQILVIEEFHCSICLLVLKDPVMCQNQHYYCSSCIKEHLANADSCPTCCQHLSVDSLIPAPRIVTDYLSKLNIHCDFYPRGCREVVQLSNLKRHVETCGFSPVQCSNDGCNVLVSKRDQLHHETEICDFRRSKCHDCGQLKKEVKEMKDEMFYRQDEMKNEVKEMKDEMKDMKDETKREMKEMKDEMKVMIDQVLARQGLLVDKMASGIKADIKNQMKNEMKEIKEQMKEIIVSAVRNAMEGKKGIKVEMEKQSSQATCSSDVRGNIIVAGGIHNTGNNAARNKPTECFNWVDQTWTLLNSAVFEGRSYACSFLYQGQMVVAGGRDGSGNRTNTLKCLNVVDPAATWKDFAVNLPVKCSGHQVVNYNDRLFMSGGWVLDDRGRFTRSDAVNEVQLVPPYSSKMLTRLPQPKVNHGMELFDNNLFILGGLDRIEVTNSVIQYDLIRSKCKGVPPLPYAVQLMATVLWRNNVLVIGGLNKQYNPCNTVFMYDLVTGRSQVMPSMKRKRSGCTAVLTDNVVVVMGGEDENREYLKSVECFDLERQVWQDLPDMLERRAYATAVVKPNH